MGRRVKAFFDTSAVVPLFVESHVHRGRAAPWFERVRTGEVRGILPLHSAAEAYRTLSTYPVVPRIEVPVLRAALHLLLDGPFEVVTPEADDYRAVITFLADREIRGRVVYDALLIQAARKSGADVILTFNDRDFRRVAPDLADRIRTP